MPATPARPDGPLFDVAFAAHKAVRRFMFDTLVQLGALDVSDGHEIDLVLDGLDRLLVVLDEPRDDWRDAMQALRHGAASQRRGSAAALYRRAASLVTRQLERLEQEDARAAGLLAPPPAAEQLQRLDGSELGDALHWMAEALTPQELAGLLDELHGGPDIQRFHTALMVLAENMDEQRWNRLARALDTRPAGMAPAAGRQRHLAS